MTAIAGINQRSEDLKLDYLKLLVTQLQYQNPLEPMDNSEMTSQLAQISQLEQLEGINSQLGQLDAFHSAFAEALMVAQGRYAASLIGRQVTFVPDGQGEVQDGRVSGVEMSDGGFLLQVGDQRVALDAIRGIRE